MTTGFTLADWVGFGGAALTTLSFLPQAWLSFKTRDVSGISLGMYSVFTVGVALWLVYGLMLGAWASRYVRTPRGHNVFRGTPRQLADQMLLLASQLQLP